MATNYAEEPETSTGFKMSGKAIAGIIILIMVFMVFVLPKCQRALGPHTLTVTSYEVTYLRDGQNDNEVVFKVAMRVHNDSNSKLYGRDLPNLAHGMVDYPANIDGFSGIDANSDGIVIYKPSCYKSDLSMSFTKAEMSYKDITSEQIVTAARKAIEDHDAEVQAKEDAKAAEKAAKEAERAEQQAKREAEEAERKAQREAEEAERKAQREAEEAQRQAERDAANAEREAAERAENGGYLISEINDVRFDKVLPQIETRFPLVKLPSFDYNTTVTDGVVYETGYLDYENSYGQEYKDRVYSLEYDMDGNIHSFICENTQQW